MTDIVYSQDTGKFPLSEGIMPVKKCLKYGNKYYCYNKENKTASVFIEQIHDLNELPDYVLGELIEGRENTHIVVNEKSKPLSDKEIDDLMFAINNAKEI